MTANQKGLSQLKKAVLTVVLCVTILAALGSAVTSYLKMERLGPFRPEQPKFQAASDSEGCACAGGSTEKKPVEAGPEKEDGEKPPVDTAKKEKQQSADLTAAQ